MIRIITAALCLLAAQPLHAQITLSAASYTTPVTGTTDTLNIAALAGFPVQTSGASQTWDLAGVAYTGALHNTHASVGTGSSFTTAQYMDNVTDSIGFYKVLRSNACGVAASGLLTYGAHYDQQIIGMDSITGSPSDTFTVLSQDVVFSRPIRNIPFPAAYSNHWDDTVSAVIHGTLTIPGMSFHNTPTDIHITYTTRDTVNGWGTLKVKNSHGLTSDVNVLQVKSFIYRQDSTFINGTFITELQKDYTGLPKEFSTLLFEYKYYAVNEVTPIANISYDNTYTTPQYAEILSKNFPSEGIAKVYDEAPVHVFPNPVTARTFSIEVPATGKNWSYLLTNAAGNVVASGQLTSGVRNNVQLIKEMPAGIYYVQVDEDGKKADAESLFIE